MSTVDLSTYASRPTGDGRDLGVCDYPFPEPIAPGWHLLTLTAKSEFTLKPRLQLDWGEGYSEASTCPVGSAGAGGFELLLRTSRPVSGVRLLSGTQEYSFEFARLARKPLNAVGVAAYLAGLVVRSAMSWPPGRRSFKVGVAPQPDGTAFKLIHPFQTSVLGLGAKGKSAQRQEDYARWMREHDYIHERDASALRSAVGRLEGRPLISVLMPVYRTPPTLLHKAIQSVVDQVYEQWELCIADDGSKSAEVREVLEGWVAKDQRIKLTFRAENGHISAATNTAFQTLATGTWVVMLDHDDELSPNALAEVALTIDRAPNAQLIYSDEDKIDEAGKRSEPYFKPDFSPELFRCQNYLNHLTAMRASAVRQAGGWREGFEGSQDYDLYLRIVEQTRTSNIIHIPKILYHWRMVKGSAALAATEKGYSAEAALTALKEHVARSDLDHQVSRTERSVYYHTHPADLAPEPLVTILIPTRDKVAVLRPCVLSILEKTTYSNFEIVIIDNGSTEPETLSFLKEISTRENVFVLRYGEVFNFSALNNFAVRRARGTLVALLNNDLEVISPDWLTQMARWAVQPGVGCVGAKLYYPDDTIQHAGVVLGIGGVAGHSHKHMARSASGYFGHLQVVRNVAAVTGACMVMRKSIYEEAGGFDEENLAIAYNDVDFCLTVSGLGYRHVWTPYAELYHKESHSRGYEDTPEKQERHSKERAHMKRKWGEALQQDPYYSPNLTLQKEDYSFR